MEEWAGADGLNFWVVETAHSQPSEVISKPSAGAGLVVWQVGQLTVAQGVRSFLQRCT